MTDIITPQPIDTAPREGGWILGLVRPDGPTDTYWQPWEILTWGDGGWFDDAGNLANPQPVSWIPLPDPQPLPTGWQPPSGRILVEEITGEGWTSNGKPVDVPWRWLISIERSDGTYDAYRDIDFAVTREEAEARGAARAVKYGLPVAVIPLPANHNVLLLKRPEGTA